LLVYIYCRKEKSKVKDSRLDFSEKYSYAKGMKRKRGRPPKAKGQRKDVDLRIPVTAEQKAKIMRAVSLEGRDMASWARPLLLKAADERLNEETGYGQRQG
jgi:hypothetical protein